MFPLIPAIIGAAASLGSAGIGAASSGAGMSEKERLLKKILAEYEGIDAPTAEAIAAEQLGPSAQEGVRGQMDPRLQAEQMDSLGTLDAYSRDGGTAESRAAMNRILGDVARQEGAGRNAILGNMRARGTSGSGAELAMQLSNHQAAADRANTAGLEQGAAVQKRMLDAAMQKGRMAGDMRGQDYREVSDAARAKDMITQYNAQGREKAKYFNSGLGQQAFQNKLTLANGKGNAMNGVANNLQAGADRAAGTANTIGQGFLQAGAAGSQYLMDEERKKKGGV